MRDLAHAFVRRDGAETVVLTGTELALLFDERDADFPVVDCARVLVAALVVEAHPLGPGQRRLTSPEHGASSPRPAP